ncbi:MAG: general secretion pathway protein GspE [Candidatus Hydrogenedentota bacterium]
MTLRVLNKTPDNVEGDLNARLAFYLRPENDNGAIEAIECIVNSAVGHEASDVHIEPWESATVVRFRVDGVLAEVATVSRAHHARLVARIKVLARMPSYFRDTPQDGRIDAGATPAGKSMRVAAIPTVGGEKIVLRLLEGDRKLHSLDGLGFHPGVLTPIKEFVLRPQGTLLLTGPSSSGKTTTIYALLRELLAVRKAAPHIVTIEDPVEYRLDRVDQTEVNPSAGLTFEAALRALLRQDPEVIVVGEIRDSETARTAIQAGLTGHLVISTIHCGSAAGVFSRLLDMGVEPYLISSSINGVLAQRLVRCVCMSCARPVVVAPAHRERYALPETVASLIEGAGCDRCLHTGYKGRMAIGEFLPLTDPIADVIQNRLGTGKIQDCATQVGMLSLEAAGLDQVLSGRTTLSELDRVLTPARGRI